MKELKSLWKETKEKFDQLEKSLVDCYIAFLREVAKVYLQQGRRVLLEDYEEKALNAIASKMSEFERVQAIYTQKYQSEVFIYILLGISEYDDELMEKLLDVEYDIRKQFPGLTFSFLYPPVGAIERKDFMHPQARCIFSHW